MPTVKQVLAKIRDLKARILKDSISPHHLGSILEEMLGYTWRDGTTGNFEFGHLKAEALDVAQLVFDRYHSVDADTAFTESDVIESVTDNGDGTFTIVFSEQYPGYVTSQIEHNILKGTYTDIPERIPEGPPPYEVANPVAVTSWLHVVDVLPEENTAIVSLWPEDACPEETNSPPMVNMTVQRWGNTGDPEDPRYAQRQELFYIDARDGRLVKLSGATRPGYDDTMMSASLGRLPEFLSKLDPRIAPGDDGLMADTVVCRRLITLDSLGRPVVQIIDRGVWMLGERYGDGSLPNDNGIYERSKAYRAGHGWLSNVGGVATLGNMPSWRNPYWTHIEGDESLQVGFAPVNTIFRPSAVDLTLDVRASYLGEDVTSDLRPSDIAWTRYSEDEQGNPRVNSDNAWNLAHACGGLSLHVTTADIGWSAGPLPKKVMFTATVTLHAADVSPSGFLPQDSASLSIFEID